VVGIVDLEAGEFSLGFVANTTFVDHFFTLHALVIMTLLDALVLSTGQKAFTKRVTDRNGLFTALSLATQQTFDAFVTRWAVNLT